MKQPTESKDSSGKGICVESPTWTVTFVPASSSTSRVAARVEKAMLTALDDVARVHLYRWGDGGAHFHVWFLPRPLGMLEAAGMMLPLWEDVLPNVPDEDLAAAAKRIAAAM